MYILQNLERKISLEKIEENLSQKIIGNILEL